MKIIDLISEVIIYFVFSILFWALFYFNYAIISQYYDDIIDSSVFNYGELAKSFAYISVFYLVLAALVLLFLNSIVTKRVVFLSYVCGIWPRASLAFKFMAILFLVYAVNLVMPNHMPA